MNRIVIVGAGTGGVVLANKLADELHAEIDAGEVAVTLVDESDEHVYKPTFLYVPFGKKTVADAKRPLSELVDRRVDLRIGRVTDLDTDAKRVAFADGETLAYDYATVATGARLTPDEVPGLVEGGHHFYGPEGAEALRDELAAFESGHLVLSVIGVPHMCPAAPVEFVLMADQWFRDRGIRDDVEITYTYPINRTHGLEPIAEWASERFAERDINAETFFNADSVDPEAGVVESMEGTELDYDLLVAIPPHDGQPLIAEAGLGDDGWVEVDRHTLQAARAPDVYAIGDAADVPTSKAGSVAHYQAGVVAERLAAQVRGGIPTATYDGKTMCFLEAGMDEATFIEFDYENPPFVRDESKAVHWAKLAYNQSYWLTARGTL
jgi:sulfide:quinone oxidoreductase